MKSFDLSILLLGTVHGTCLDRANSLRRLGHHVEHIDLEWFIPKSPWVDRIVWRLGGQWFSPLIARRLPRAMRIPRYDLCVVDSGELVTKQIINLLRSRVNKIVNYNVDDPLGTRDGARFRVYRKSLPYYDLCVVMRPQNVNEAYSRGAKDVLHVYRSADEITHAPRAIAEKDHQLWDTEVLFLGTWFPERGPFLVELIKRGVPLTIRGANWNKAPEWSELQPFWRGGQIQGDDYAKAIQCAKVNLGLLSKGNRDLHTSRSLEVPALGALFCAERTTEHIGMYEEGTQALFWEGPDECAAMCRLALEDEDRRKAIAAAGRARLLTNGYYNENIMRKVILRAKTANSFSDSHSTSDFVQSV